MNKQLFLRIADRLLVDHYKIRVTDTNLEHQADLLIAAGERPYEAINGIAGDYELVRADISGFANRHVKLSKQDEIKAISALGIFMLDDEPECGCCGGQTEVVEVVDGLQHRLCRDCGHEFNAQAESEFWQIVDSRNLVKDGVSSVCQQICNGTTCSPGPVCQHGVDQKTEWPARAVSSPELIFVELDNGDTALFVNGDAIHQMDAGEEGVTPLTIGDALAKQLNVNLQCFKLSVPDDEEWAWNDIYETLPPALIEQKFYAISGRIPGTKDDVIYLFKAASYEEACATFAEKLWVDETEEDRDAILREHGVDVLIDAAVVSKSEIVVAS